MIGQAVRFGGWTLISAAVSLGLPVLLHEAFGIPEKLAVAIALATAFALNFVGIRGLVFRKQGGARGDFVRFLGTSLAFRLGEYGAFLLLFDVARMDYRPALLIPLLASFILKFFVYRLFVFRHDHQP